MTRWAFLFLSILLAACAARQPLSTPIDEPIASAHCFLAARYNPTIGLLQESPITAPNRYWLATDNRLAIYALHTVGDRKHAVQIEQNVADYGEHVHGLIEALTGANIQWPPRTETQNEIEHEVWNEHRLTGTYYEDWEEYADLAFYAALDSHNEGNEQEAIRRYRAAMGMFNGIGFVDKPYAAPTDHGLFATYKLALALYVAAQIKEPPDSRLLPALLSKQDRSGGFITLYDETGIPQGDANTETTSYALLALTATYPRADSTNLDATKDTCVWPE